MDITCRNYTPTGTNVSRELCEPKFMTDRRARNVSDWQQQLDELLTPRQLRVDLSVQLAALAAAMNAVGEENPYFQELNAILRILNERLEEISG
jgi:hypothetical protein